jgi:DNA mismatch repair protein MSH3
MDYAHAFEALSKFYAAAAQGEGDNTTLATITGFPRAVVVALAHAIEYLSTFGVQHALLETRFFARFAERTCMLLGSNTLTNLCVVRPFDLATCDADGPLQGDLQELG